MKSCFQEGRNVILFQKGTEQGNQPVKESEMSMAPVDLKIFYKSMSN